jgi:hypothetical protein
MGEREDAEPVHRFRSGFGWEDRDFRYCVMNGQHYAYGRTPEEAEDKFRRLVAR